MYTASAREIRKELQYKTQNELIEICMRASRFKKDTKELLSYLLFEAENEDHYIASIQQYIDNEFLLVKKMSPYRFQKAIRKILRTSKKYCRYSGKKETEAAVLLHFCEKMIEHIPKLKNRSVLKGIYIRQMALAEKAISSLHEDLQYDYKQMAAKLSTLN